MKKCLTVLSILCALFILAACNTNDDTPALPTETTPQGDYAPVTEPPDAHLPDEALIIQIAAVADTPLDDFTRLYHTDSDLSEYGIDLVIWANQPLLHFSMVALESDWLYALDTWGYRPHFHFGSIDILQPGEAFVVVNYMGAGTMPHRGFNFYDMHKSITRMFFFQENNAYPEGGGPWIFREIEADRIIWTPAEDSDPPNAEDNSIVINGVPHAGSAYTLLGHPSPTHVSMDVLWHLGLGSISAGIQSSLQYNDGEIGVMLNMINYLTFGTDRVPVGINDTFMADDGFFTGYIPITLLAVLGFDVHFENEFIHINGQFNMPITPHPLATALANHTAHAQWETIATTPHIDGHLGVLVIDFIEPAFPEATLFVYTGTEVIAKEIGSIAGFPFSIGFTADGGLVKKTGDGGGRSYTTFGIAPHPTTGLDEIIYVFTIYDVANDDGSRNYYRFNGGWQEGMESGRHAITEAEFNDTRDAMGNHLWCWRDTSDSTEWILCWAQSVW